MAQSSSLPVPRAAEIRLRALVAGVGSAGALCILFAVQAAGATQSVPAANLLLTVALFCAGDLAVVPMRHGRDRHAFTWSEAAVVFGLVLVPRPWLCICAALAVALADVARGRDPVKIVFDAASMTVATSLALLVLHAFGDPAQLHGPARWSALATAAAVCFLVNTAAVSAAVALSEGHDVHRVLVRRVGVRAAVFAGNTVIALLLVDVAWTPALVTAVPVFVAALYVAYRAYLKARDDGDSWRLLERASKDLIGLHARAVAERAIDHAVALLPATGAEVLLRRRDGRVDHYSGGAQARRHDIVDAAVLESMDLTSDTLVTTVPHWAQSGETSPFLLTVPLEAAGRIGALRLRFRGDARLSSHERHVLVTFARSIALHLNNALLFEGLEAAARQHEHDATHDALTGLPNRALLSRHVEQVLNEPGRDARCALLVVDLDHFKSINDTLGHATGDRLLVIAAQRLVAATRPGDMVARLGGDEFAVFIDDLETPDDADTLARGILAALGRPVLLDGLRLSVEASIGVSCHPDDACDIGEMLAHADIALYQAKKVRCSHRRYRADRDDSSLSRLSLAVDLRSALRDGDLVLHYQPQYRLVDGTIAGAEALVRWRHPTRGLLQPDDFIAVAEDSGLAHDFTRHVIALAVQEAACWQRPDRPVHVSVNLSARNLLDPDLPHAVSSVLAEHDLDPALLVLEITETTMITELDTVEQTLSGLRALGVELSVDDFGTGYSSLRFLTRNAVNELKIDREFVLRMQTSDTDAAIVRATLELGHALGLRVVAEGVEEQPVLASLAALGCHHAQGYLLARPMPAAALRERLSGADVVRLPPKRAIDLRAVDAGA